MNNPKFKPGDRVVGTVQNISPNGVSLVGSSLYVIKDAFEHAKPNYDEWKGKQLSETPEGTVAVVYRAASTTKKLYVLEHREKDTFPVIPTRSTKTPYSKPCYYRVYMIIKLGVEPEVEELTLKQVCEQLGREIKIVKE